MKYSKNSFLFLWITLSFWTSNCFTAKAQDFSYVYIQGDKKTPIYTKVEGVMMPRYGKNYALLSRLAPGPLNVEILFQQNEFPAVQFNILVPENGKRAFVLQKKEDGFALYDVQQNFYLKANNSIEEDHLPTILSNASLAKEKAFEPKTEMPVEVKTEVSTAEKQAEKSVETPKVETVETTTEPAIETKTDTIKEEPLPVANVENSSPKFIENITFDNSANTTKAKETSINTDGQTTDENKKEETIPVIINSDCKNQISSLNYLKLSNSIIAKKSENERLGLIVEAIKQNCFSSEQAQKLIEKLDSDVAKFSALKNIYPKITDQANFGALESLLSDEEWKEYFKNLVQNKQ